MTQMVRVDVETIKTIAVIAKDDTVWLTHPGWLRWWLTLPSQRRYIVLTLANGEKYRARAVRIAKRYVRLG
jgi:hypothetical protein